MEPEPFGASAPPLNHPILVVGSINMDLVMRASHVPASGETMYGEQLRAIPGGKGANQAVAVARLGRPVLMAGRVGRDQFGDALLAGLAADGVDITCMERDPEEASGTTFIFVEPDGRNTIVVATGANGRFSPRSADRLAGLLERVQVVLLQLELPVESTARVIELARAAGKPVVLDAGPIRRDCPPAIYQVSVLSPNEAETEALAGMAIPDQESALRAARLLLSKGPGAVVLKLGARGALLASAGKTLHLPAHAVRAVDTTAAGDAFSAALAVSLAEGRELEDAVRVANAAGALAATKAGAQPSMPTRVELAAFLRKA
jgi:ribokinase